MKLETIKTIRATINFKADKSEIFKYPIQFDYFTREPYLEGSTIKGALRYIMSENLGKVERFGDIHMCSDKICHICNVFGRCKEESIKAMNGPTRFSIRDLYLTDTCRGRLNKVIKEYKSQRELEQYLEELEFELIIHYKVFSIDGNSDIDEAGFKKLVESVELLPKYGIGKNKNKIVIGNINIT